MRPLLIIGLCVLSTPALTLQAQEQLPAMVGQLPAMDRGIRADSGFRIVDFVDLPGDWISGVDGDRNTGVDGDGNTGVDGGWHLEFRETWHIDPERPSIVKEVEEYRPLNDSLPDVSPDSLRSRFAALVRAQAADEEVMNLRGITCEFILLDPHLGSSGNVSFPSPDSMDRETIALQRALISLIGRRSRAASGFDLKTQLLSVYFHEDWQLDPVSLEITRKVGAITPVIWQRRKTVRGEPVNDGDTGYPVYYKNTLERIELRNP